MTCPRLVAHRGFASRYPENTIESLRAALELGVPWVEFDVQLSRDLVPVLLHDTDFVRTGGRDESVFDLSAIEISALEVNESHRLGSAFTGVTPPTLASVLELLSDYPGARALVEIKCESLDRWGVECALEKVFEVLVPHAARTVLLCYDATALEYARNLIGISIAWILTRYDAISLARAREFSPDYLICNYRKLSDGPLWPGPWSWALYEITDPVLALALYARGAALIETMAVGDLLLDPRLAGGALHSTC